MGFFDFMKRKKNEFEVSEDKNSQDLPYEENKEENGSQNNVLTSEEKRQKVLKRIVSMGEKLDDLSTQVYHLQQRIEVLEKKMRVNNFEGN